MSKATTLIGPADHGRRMTLEEFEEAEVREGYLYELGRGALALSNVPGPSHFQILLVIRNKLILYQFHAGAEVYAVFGGGECRIRIAELESERHPDVAVYKTPFPADAKGADIWSAWVPEIVVEIVSPGSKERDFEEKPEEYHRFGVMEYWVVDAEAGAFRVLTRSGAGWDERVLRAGDVLRTGLLPGFELDVREVLAAGKAEG